jgi:hypothetical protein
MVGADKYKSLALDPFILHGIDTSVVSEVRTKQFIYAANARTSLTNAINPSSVPPVRLKSPHVAQINPTLSLRQPTLMHISTTPLSHSRKEERRRNLRCYFFMAFPAPAMSGDIS